MSGLLTAEQQIRLAVFQGISSYAYDMETIVQIVNGVSSAIIGDDGQVASATADTQVIYEGITLTNIPEWAEYVAGDYDGGIYLFEFEPELSGDVWAHVKGELNKHWDRLPKKLESYPLQKLASRK